MAYCLPIEFQVTLLNQLPVLYKYRVEDRIMFYKYHLIYCPGCEPRPEIVNCFLVSFLAKFKYTTVYIGFIFWIVIELLIHC